LRLDWLATFTVPLLTFGAGLFAQTGPVRGTVVDSLGGPLPGAVVELLRSNLSVRTDQRGEFRFSTVSAGLEVLQVRALGYRMLYRDIQVEPVRGWTGSISLQAVATELPELAVRAPSGRPPEYAHTIRYDDFFRRRRMALGGVFRTREDIERMGADQLPAVLKGIPGVRVSWNVGGAGAQNLRIHIARCSRQPPDIAIYLDGKRLYPRAQLSQSGSELTGVGLMPGAGIFRPTPGDASDTRCRACEDLADLFAMVPIRDVEFVEFYRGVAQIPSDLDRDACAALVVWTRAGPIERSRPQQ
jgi:hypothetical protein